MTRRSYYGNLRHAMTRTIRPCATKAGVNKAPLVRHRFRPEGSLPEGGICCCGRSRTGNWASSSAQMGKRGRDGGGGTDHAAKRGERPPVRSRHSVRREGRQSPSRQSNTISRLAHLSHLSRFACSTRSPWNWRFVTLSDEDRCRSNVTTILGGKINPSVVPLLLADTTRCLLPPILFVVRCLNLRD